jgi:hypothetical protein
MQRNRREFLAAGVAAMAAPLVSQDGRAEMAVVSPYVRREFDKLLDPKLQPVETGFQRLEDGRGMTCALHKMIGCKWHMIDWFIDNYTAEEYKMFHPDHVSVVFEAGGIRKMEEKIGGQTVRGKFQILDSARYYAESALRAAEIAGVKVSRGGPASGDGWTGLNVYVGRDKGYGCEIRARYFNETDPPDTRTREERMAVSDAGRPAGLAHVLEEFAYLAGFLPALYAKRHG